MKAKVSTPTLEVVREGPLVGLSERVLEFVDPILGNFRHYRFGCHTPFPGVSTIFCFFV